ncbi:MAG: phasin family protein [Alphaproteobacteria bacterium]|nr:phasin family protein [Alphaproteobacteria bacterium]
MTNKNPFADFFSQNDFSKMFENYQTIPFDVKSFLETQRKNAQALSEAQQLAVENIQAIAQRQTEILSQMVEDNSNIAREMMNEGTPEEKISKNADLFRSLYERSIKNLNELGEMINTSNQEAGKIINKRVSATMNEIKSSLEKAQQKKAA